jgi:hypothetical protein
MPELIFLLLRKLKLNGPKETVSADLSKKPELYSARSQEIGRVPWSRTLSRVDPGGFTQPDRRWQVQGRREL